MRYVVEPVTRHQNLRSDLSSEMEARQELAAYLEEVLTQIQSCEPRSEGILHSGFSNVPSISENLYRTLTSRRFACCSRSSSNEFRQRTLEIITRSVRIGEPVPFYLDIGGGYSAAVCLPDHEFLAGENELCFAPHCLYLLCLAQIARFQEAISSIYPVGMHMTLVIDNLVANYVNEVPLTHTLRFCDRLQQTIENLGMQSRVSLLIESEVSDFSKDEMSSVSADKLSRLSESEYHNILRFSYRWQSRDEAEWKSILYQKVATLSERHLSRHIEGVHLTQRRSQSCLSFRSFPGGCARIQTGRASFQRNSKGKLIPRLLSTTNFEGEELLYLPLDQSIQFFS